MQVQTSWLSLKKKKNRSDSPSRTQLLPATAGDVPCRERKICHPCCSPSAGMAPGFTEGSPSSRETTVLMSLYQCHCPRSLWSVQFMAWLFGFCISLQTFLEQSDRCIVLPPISLFLQHRNSCLRDPACDVKLIQTIINPNSLLGCAGESTNCRTSAVVWHSPVLNCLFWLGRMAPSDRETILVWCSSYSFSQFLISAERLKK